MKRARSTALQCCSHHDRTSVGQSEVVNLKRERTVTSDRAITKLFAEYLAGHIAIEDAAASPNDFRHVRKLSGAVQAFRQMGNREQGVFRASTLIEHIFNCA